VRQYAEHLSDEGLVIFLLHGVVAEPTTGVRNYTRKHIAAGELRELCAALLERGTPVGAEEAVAGLRGDSELPARSFLLTYDDGFANNLEVAAPVMRELGVPAIFYVTTGFVDEQGASWIDLIEEAVARTERQALRLPWEDGERPAATAKERIALLDEVRRVLKSSAALDPYAAADEIRREAAVGPFEPDEMLDRKLDWDGVRELAADALFTVGGHSHTHRILSHLSAEELAVELDRSLGLLERHLGRRPTHYSYPEGLEGCWSDAVIAGLRERGIECCPTALPGVNRVGDDLFALRRVFVP